MPLGESPVLMGSPIILLDDMLIIETVSSEVLDMYIYSLLTAMPYGPAPTLIVPWSELSRTFNNGNVLVAAVRDVCKGLRVTIP